MSTQLGRISKVRKMLTLKALLEGVISRKEEITKLIDFSRKGHLFV